MKVCNKCRIKKPLASFNKRGKDGLNSFCRECNKAYQENKQYYVGKAARANQRKVKWFKEAKGVLKCARCPENHIACLDFHYIDHSKKENIVSRMVLTKKCVVPCSNCHRKHHCEERDGT